MVFPMCCQLIVTPAPNRLNELLRVAGFVPGEYGAGPTWSRCIPSEATTVRVRLGAVGLEFSLYPPVTSFATHAGKRLAASLMFQTAALLAERTSGTITQRATVEGCMAERSSVSLVASYPEMTLLWQNVCPGFREALA